MRELTKPPIERLPHEEKGVDQIKERLRIFYCRNSAKYVKIHLFKITIKKKQTNVIFAIIYLSVKRESLCFHDALVISLFFCAFRSDLANLTRANHYFLGAIEGRSKLKIRKNEHFSHSDP